MQTNLLKPKSINVEPLGGHRAKAVLEQATLFPGGMYSSAFGFFMNQDKWNKLSKQDQAIIEKYSFEYAARSNGKSWDAADQRGLEALKKANTKIVRADPGFAGGNYAHPIDVATGMGLARKLGVVTEHRLSLLRSLAPLMKRGGSAMSNRSRARRRVRPSCRSREGCPAHTRTSRLQHRPPAKRRADRRSRSTFCFSLFYLLGIKWLNRVQPCPYLSGRVLCGCDVSMEKLCGTN